VKFQTNYEPAPRSSSVLCPLFNNLHTQNPIHQKDNTFGTQTINQPRNLALACRLRQPQKKKKKFEQKKKNLKLI